MLKEINPREFQKRRERYFKMFFLTSLFLCFFISFGTVWLVTSFVLINQETAKASELQPEVKGVSEEFLKNRKNSIISTKKFDPNEDNQIFDSDQFIFISIPKKPYFRNKASQISIKQYLIETQNTDAKIQSATNNILRKYPNKSLYIPYLYQFDLEDFLVQDLPINEVSDADKNIKICLNNQGLNTTKSLIIATKSQLDNFTKDGSICILNNELEDILILQSIN
jgi:hypothetical protein